MHPEEDCSQVVFTTNPSFSNNHTFVSKTPNVITESLDTLKPLFDAKILNIASTICLQYQRSKTSNVTLRNNLIVHCIYEAFMQVGYAVPIEFIYDRLQLDKKQKRVKRSSKNFSWGVQIVYPKQLIPFYVDRIQSIFVIIRKLDRDNIILEVNRILDRCTSTPTGQTWTDNKPSNPIAVAALYYYLNQKLENSLHIKHFADSCYLSNVCLNEYLKTLTKILDKATRRSSF